MTAQARVHNTRKWLLRSQADLRVAKADFANPGVHKPYHICFWAQQAAEKALKAGLVFSGIPHERIHDLDEVAARLPADFASRRYAGKLQTLSQYAVDTRYPDPVKEPTAADAGRAIRQTEEIFATLIQDLQNHGFPIQGKQGPRPPSQATDTSG